MKTNVVKNYLQKAEHDLGSAEILYKQNPDYTDTITFHSQQTIEKVLKAFLSFHNTKVKSNHDIIRLLKDCSEIDGEFSGYSTPSVYELNEIGMSVRYDDIQNDPKKEEAYRYLELARELRELVIQKLIQTGFEY